MVVAAIRALGVASDHVAASTWSTRGAAAAVPLVTAADAGAVVEVDRGSWDPPARVTATAAITTTKATTKATTARRRAKVRAVAAWVDWSAIA